MTIEKQLRSLAYNHHTEEGKPVCVKFPDGHIEGVLRIYAMGGYEISIGKSAEIRFLLKDVVKVDGRSVVVARGVSK